MFTLKHGSETFTAKIKTLSYLVKNSKLESILDGKSDNLEFKSYLNSFGYIPDNIDNDWIILTHFLNKKTIFHTSSIVTKHDDAINVLSEYVPSSLLIDRLRLNIIPQNIPKIIQQLGLTNMYEQLIFYEYIYTSENVSYLTKASIIT